MNGTGGSGERGMWRYLNTPFLFQSLQHRYMAVIAHLKVHRVLHRLVLADFGTLRSLGQTCISAWQFSLFTNIYSLHTSGAIRMLWIRVSE